MLAALRKISSGARSALIAWVLLALVLILQYIIGWIIIEMARISKETDLGKHLADLGRLAPATLRAPALAMADLALANLAAHFAGRPLLTPVPECAAPAVAAATRGRA